MNSPKLNLENAQLTLASAKRALEKARKNSNPGGDIVQYSRSLLIALYDLRDAKGWAERAEQQVEEEGWW